MMVKIEIDQEKCKECGLCVYFCPKGVLKMSEKTNQKGYHFVELIREEREKCTGCANCWRICPDACVKVIRN